jgi:phage shock protein E
MHTTISIGILLLAGLAGCTFGGRCTYDQFPGHAVITRVEKTPASVAQAKDTGFEGYEVWLTFAPDRPVSKEYVQEFLQKPHRFQLMNSWCPGAAYLQKYGLSKDKTFPATLFVLTHGTCTPILIELNGVDRADYFELPSAAPAKSPRLCIIDVRTDEEWTTDHVAGALHLPLDQVRTGIGTLVPDKATAIGVYCAHGMRAGRAAKILKELGYSHVENLGGLDDAKKKASNARGTP